ncbi:potassium-transporting ATPase subunit KdpA [Pseudoxanthomonas winnipegensis]|jgi:K+-transporting ATPase ATPase A chain|uniref:Potassium-transporting ATPase potassium-binding subunit n=1 Tax=Pseudoxanthomonas winnipegensis TaxID=2480810 RepID=A0A4V2HEV2_9GAMM|nr:potassium-transporting ATPase subunit KdpA [Pseudoxanthomonas winnipegensis]RZZ88329.1 potassium-transporting ATPase subunit KdpA [Pseudoxanthomonas winnipegensis]TAA09648.1 potassium-transporting ATPase subunit KdpA [Pseudoxanthomonas winnipegensis]TAA22974.1 potassium-transporting ATPase subunit KdpA [Pseudoxanthomonas winnipegensis]TAA34615.1 potassium-transporting ATPase subunit KdpA [Pseudoxanthomonas winnipegensis]TAH73385.1 potassium-transporting ATPase subunit KdpA [Pseudoxanthomona
MLEIFLILAAALLLAWPLGLYLARVMRGAPMRGDALFGLVERPLYALLGVDPARGMSWRGYAGAFVLSNVVVGVLVWAMFMTQAWLPLNPDGVPNMRWDLALHTMVSFLTNTNQQHYSGQAQLSYLSQMVAITGLQVITPMMGLGLAVATLRAFFGKGRAADAQEGDARAVDVGNYYSDVIRACVRFMLPLCLLWTLLLGSQGVPSTLQAGPTATPIAHSADFSAQKLPLGPVAAMVAVKQLGTNGGGWYGPNSAMPLENPTPFSNALECIALVLIPIAVVVMVGAFTGRRKLAGLIFGSMLAMSAASTAALVWAEGHSASAASPLLMEGKEVRFGADASALWAALTTQTSNGSVNAMHDSLSPLSGGVAMIDMLINAIWGGIGCGLQQFIVYLLLGVFLAGLMTGRTPELFGRKIETGQVKLLALLILLQPIVLLLFTAIALAVPALTANSNPGFHGISQVFYEYASAFANNGSGFEGLGDSTPWWNLSCTLVLLLGRYPALIVPLVVAAQLAAKRAAPESPGSLQIETPTFALTLIAVIAVLTVLQFMPVLVLGPVAEHLALMAH